MLNIQKGRSNYTDMKHVGSNSQVFHKVMMDDKHQDGKPSKGKP